MVSAVPARAAAIPKRAFHSSPFVTFTCQQASRTSLTASISRRLAKKPFRAQFRGYQSGASTQQLDSQTKWRKIATSAAIFGGTLVAINLVFNSDGRTDGGMTPYQRAYLNETFMHTGLGVGVIGLTARQMVNSGFVWRIMTASPWVVVVGGLAASFGTMIATRMVDPDK